MMHSRPAPNSCIPLVIICKGNVETVTILISKQNVLNIILSLSFIDVDDVDVHL